MTERCASPAEQGDSHSSIIMPLMCGIAGMMRFDDRPIDEDRLRAMLDHVRYRGPDGMGVRIMDRCGLAHARLSIIDLVGGKQPMGEEARGEGPDGGACVSVRERAIDNRGRQSGPEGLHVVFNGEIYNHRALRDELEALGHRFHSDHSDTEVLLPGFRQWGTDLPEHLEGMFALAIWDQGEQRLFLARDRIGQKPLYLRQDERELAFASLAATLIAIPAPSSRTPQGRREEAAWLTFLRYGYTFEQSMIEGVEELPPGHWMMIQRDGMTRRERYWMPNETPTTTHPDLRSKTRSGPACDVEQTLREAVACRLEADVPLGCFLSGGIDSSLIAAIAQQSLRKRGAPPLKTFSVAMPDLAYDESEHARTAAEHIGADHTVLHLGSKTADDVIADLTHLMEVSGEPTADSSLLPTYWLCRAAREHVKVALSGDGGDELFGGYDRYRALTLLERPLIRRAAAMMPSALFAGVNPRSRRVRLGRLVDAANAGPDPARQYHRMIHLFSETQIRELGIEGVSDRTQDTSPFVADSSGAAWGKSDTGAVFAAMQWDLAHYLPYEVLRKVDRASMAVALEVRSPMLDSRVCELAMSLPPRVLMPHGRLKGLLRDVAARYLPTSIVRRPKRGFALPIGGWFRTWLKDALADHLFDGTLADMGLASVTVRRYFDEHVSNRADHTHRLFALLELALWGRNIGVSVSADMSAKADTPTIN